MNPFFSQAVQKQIWAEQQFLHPIFRHGVEVAYFDTFIPIHRKAVLDELTRAYFQFNLGLKKAERIGNKQLAGMMAYQFELVKKEFHAWDMETPGEPPSFFGPEAGEAIEDDAKSDILVENGIENGLDK